MDSIPRVSVIISVYNNEKFLRESLDSLINQNYHNFEVILTDDCSTDGSFDIMREYESKDSRFRVFRNEHNIGLTKTLNKMIPLSRGEYIARLDGDDNSYPERFTRQLAILDRDLSVSMVHTNSNLIDDESRFICRAWKPGTARKIEKIQNKRNYIEHSSIMIRKAVLSDFMYDESYIKGQDWDLWKRLLNKGHRFAYIPAPLIDFRLNPNSVRKIWNPGEDPAYFYANVCLANHRRIRSMKYWNDIIVKNKKKYLIKLFLPHLFVNLIKRSRQ